MVSERVVISLVFGSVQAIMLTGVLLTKSIWVDLSAFRIDLELLFACVIFLATFLLFVGASKLRLVRFDCLISVLITLGQGLLVLAGLQMIFSLSLLHFRSRENQVLREAYEKHYLVIIISWISVLFITIFFGVILHVFQKHNSHLKRWVRRYETNSKIKRLISEILSDPTSPKGLQACSNLLDIVEDPYGSVEWTIHFRQWIVLEYAKPKARVRDLQPKSDGQMKMCRFCLTNLFHHDLWMVEGLYQKSLWMHLDCLLTQGLVKQDVWAEATAYIRNKLPQSNHTN